MVFSDILMEQVVPLPDAAANAFVLAGSNFTSSHLPNSQGTQLTSLRSIDDELILADDISKRWPGKTKRVKSLGNRQRFNSQSTIRGTRRKDRIVGTNRSDTLKGLGGNDVLLGRGKGDRLLGDGGHDRIYGGRGDDLLSGGKGRDRLFGGRGDDILDGGKGKDFYRGGNGKDTLITGLGDGSITLGKADVVAKFQDGKDIVELDGIEFESLDVFQGTGSRTSHTIIQHRDTGEYLLVLKNVDSSTVTSEDFVVRASEPNIDVGTGNVSSFVNSGVRFNSSNPSDEADVETLGGSSITVGSRSFYIGYRQVSSINQNPILVSFDSQNPDNNWSRTDYEVTGSDSRGYGLFWSGSDLYAAFSIDGAQGTSDEDFRRASQETTQSWLRSYGSGGGAKISVLARIDPLTGELLDAAHLSALLSNGKSNSLIIEDIRVNDSGNLVVHAQSWFAPRNPDGSRMSQVGSGSSPFDYTLEITPDLKQVVSTAADGWR